MPRAGAERHCRFRQTPAGGPQQDMRDHACIPATREKVSHRGSTRKENLGKFRRKPNVKDRRYRD